MIGFEPFLYISQRPIVFGSNLRYNTFQQEILFVFSFSFGVLFAFVIMSLKSANVVPNYQTLFRFLCPRMYLVDLALYFSFCFTIDVLCL